MAKRVLVLGSTGKMGGALMEALGPDHFVVGKNSSHFDASDFEQVRSVIEEVQPDVVLNAAAFLGIDACEKEPVKAFMLNTLYPKYLAELSNEKGFVLVHFSTDAVFNGEKKDFYIESDAPKPLNVYGLSKHGGDCMIQALAKRHYIIRISLLLGHSGKNTQFVEKMLLRIRQGATVLKVSDDIILSPTYSVDVAREVKKLWEGSYPFGLYHAVNEGKPSLYMLMREIVVNLNLAVTIEKASYKDFPSPGIKNTFTPLKSGKIGSLRPWDQAVKEYCDRLVAGRTYAG